VLAVTDPLSREAWRRLGADALLVDAKDPWAALSRRLVNAAHEDGAAAKAPVPGTDALPTGWFLGLAIAFALIAGPLNLWWVRRRGQPFLLLVSTPVISVATCVILVVIALLSDGLGRQRSAVQLAIIDPLMPRAAVFSGITWFCGLAPGSFDLDAEDRAVPMDPEEIEHGYRRGDRMALDLDWTNGHSARSGWIPARVNRQLAFVGLRPERRRLGLTRQGDGWQVENGLGVEIRHLVWCDAAGAKWTLDALSAGAVGALRADRSSRAIADLSPVLRRLGVDARLAVRGLGVQPGTWVANLSQPLHPLPGPSAEDAAPVEAWAAGTLSSSNTPTAPATPEGF
jgi:hypothetical protein